MFGYEPKGDSWQTDFRWFRVFLAAYITAVRHASDSGRIDKENTESLTRVEAIKWLPQAEKLPAEAKPDVKFKFAFWCHEVSKCCVTAAKITSLHAASFILLWIRKEEGGLWRTLIVGNDRKKVLWTIIPANIYVVSRNESKSAGRCVNFARKIYKHGFITSALNCLI